MQLWPMVAPGPTSTPCAPLTCTTAQSCTLAPRAHDDRLEVGAHHGVVPDRRALLDRHVADEDRGRRDERRRMHARRFSFEAEQWHDGCPPQYAQKCPHSSTRRRPEVTEWNCRGSRPSPPPHRPSASRRPSCWPWPATGTSAAADSSRPATSSGRHLYIDPATLPPRRVGGRAQRPVPARRPRARRGRAALRARPGGLAPRGRGLSGHHDVHGSDDAEPRRPPGGSSRLPPRRAARPRR